MNMEFNPNNNIIRLCMQGMQAEEKGQAGEAEKLFTQAWGEATNEFEQFIAAYYIARRKENTADRLEWYEKALQLALRTDSDAIKGAYPALHTNIAECYERMGNTEQAVKHRELAASYANNSTDKGPFYH